MSTPSPLSTIAPHRLPQGSSNVCSYAPLSYVSRHLHTASQSSLISNLQHKPLTAVYSSRTHSYLTQKPAVNVRLVNPTHSTVCSRTCSYRVSFFVDTLSVFWPWLMGRQRSSYNAYEVFCLAATALIHAGAIMTFIPPPYPSIRICGNCGVEVSLRIVSSSAQSKGRPYYAVCTVIL